MLTSVVARMILVFSALLLPAAQAAGDGSHSVTVHVLNGKSAYTQDIPMTEGSQGNHIGPVNAANGVSRQLIFNGLLAGDGGARGALNLQYQLELSGGPGSQGRSIQGQGEVAIRPGDELAVIKCGPWTVTLGLDVKPAAKKIPIDAAWNPAGLANYRLTADMRAGGSKQQCRLISRAGAQLNVADSIMQGGRKHGFVLNSLFAPSDNSGGFNLQYRIEHGLDGSAEPFQMQNEAALTLNTRKSFSGQNYKLEFLLEDKAPSKRTDGGKK